MKVTVSVSNDLVTDQRVHKVCTTLKQNGYEVKLVGRELLNSKPIERPYPTERMCLLFYRTFFFYAEFNIRLFFYLLFDKTDIYLSNDTDTLLANYLASVFRRKPLVFDAHEIFPETPEVTDRTLVKRTWTLIEDLIFPRLKNSYTVCESIAKYYNEKYKINMQVVRNIPPKKAKKLRLASQASPINVKGKKVILYQGAVNRGRGIEWMIDAMPLLNNYVFYVVGDGDVLKKLKEKVKRMDLSDKVIFTGKIPFENISAYTAKADIGINLLENWGLSYYYSLPNRIFDYIREGVPVLASDFPEIRKIIKRYDTGILINNFDQHHIVSAIKRLSLKGKNNAAFETANKELCWENEAAVLLKVMKNAVDNY
jgi:glycosyltransferase involved in cell wall biosynthesis